MQRKTQRTLYASSSPDISVILNPASICTLVRTGDSLRRCDAVGDKKIARYYDKRLRHLSLRFRGYDNITAQDLRDCFDPQANVSIPWNFTLQNWATRFMEFILC